MTDDRIGVAFAGCGSISRLYTDIYAGLSDVARVVAVADPQPERAEHRRARQIEAYHAASHAARLRAGESRDDETRAQELRKAALAESAAIAGIRVYRDHEGLLRDEEVQAMVLLTTPTVRSEPTIAAAEAGRHVFTQGPMAASVADAAAMADAVRSAGVKFHSQCGARYPRGIALARRAVEKSLLGQVASARVELNWFRPQSYYQGWHGTWSGEGGGAAFHHGRYIIDPFLWVLGSRVVELFAYAGPALREIEHENLTHAAMRYSNGATGTIHASLLNHKQRLTPSGRFEILGRDASMLVGEEYFNQALRAPTTGRPTRRSGSETGRRSTRWTHSPTKCPTCPSAPPRSTRAGCSWRASPTTRTRWCPSRCRCTTWRSCGPCTSRRTRALR